MEKKVVEKKYAELLGDDRFDMLGQILRQPNIFEILRITQYEIRHSNFLAWLLDPNGTHGLGSFFLIKFLKDAFLKSISNNLSVAEVASLAASKVRVYREWNNIDILLEFSDLVLVIENKVWSGEHDEQLQRYKEVIEKNFQNHRHFYVFLTPYGQPASMPDIYVSYSYRDIVRILEMLLRVNAASMNSNSRLYINDYINSLKLHIMGNSEANDLAKKIYYSHKDLFDFIISNRPDPVSEIEKVIKEKVISDGGTLGSPGPGFIRFLSKNLGPIIPRDGGSRGWPQKEAFLFEIYLHYAENRLRIYCTLPPDPCPSKPLLKKGLDEAFGLKKDHEGWIPYFDHQITYNPLEIASKGTDSIKSFVEEIWPFVESMIAKTEESLVPLLTKKETNEQLN